MSVPKLCSLYTERIYHFTGSFTVSLLQESYDEDLKETATYKAAQEILATVPA